jgi:Fe2+ or Zn2+ uptake regulation protein
MIVDFESSPKDSIIYSSGIVLKYLKSKGSSKNIEDLFKLCKMEDLNYATFFLAIDWLFLIGVIKEINDKNEVVLCD